MIDLDERKTSLEMTLRDSIIAGDVGAIVRIEGDLRALEIHRFAAKAKQIKDDIADCESRKREFENDKENLAPERAARVETLTTTTKAMRGQTIN